MSTLPFRWPVWSDVAGRVRYVGRDLRGHFTSPETIEEPCPHACCRGPQKTVTVKTKAPKEPKAKRERAPRHRVPTRDGFGGGWTPRASAAGTDKRAAGRRRARHTFSDYLESHYAAAEEATNGYMVTKAARARGITGADFFKPGRRPSVEKWGSDELKAWFRAGDTGTRRILTAGEFQAQQKADAG